MLDRKFIEFCWSQGHIFPAKVQFEGCESHRRTLRMGWILRGIPPTLWTRTHLLSTFPSKLYKAYDFWYFLQFVKWPLPRLLFFSHSNFSHELERELKIWIYLPLLALSWLLNYLLRLWINQRNEHFIFRLYAWVWKNNFCFVSDSSYVYLSLASSKRTPRESFPLLSSADKLRKVSQAFVDIFIVWLLV